MPAGQSETKVVRHEVRIAARPETVFAYFTDPAKITQWMGTEATLDPRPGGICRIGFAPRKDVIAFWAAHGGMAQGQARFDGVFAMSGEFVELDFPRRIVIAWGWETALFSTPPRSTTVEVALEPDGDETVVQLAHWRIPPVGGAFHDAGWGHYLPRLATVAGGGDPEPDPWLVASPPREDTA